MAKIDTGTSGGGSTSSGSTSTSGSSSGGGGGKVVPSWVWNPRSKVLGIVLSFLVSGFATVSRRFTGAVAAVWAEVTGAYRGAGLAVESAFASGGLAILDAQETVNSAIAEAAGASGLGAPLVIAILFAVAAALTFAALRALANTVKWVT